MWPWQHGADRDVLSFVTAAIAAVAGLLATPATAQTVTDANKYLAVRAGVNVERAEDNLSGQSPGVGVAIGLGMDDAWGTEIELWYPRRFATDARGAYHRDMLVSVGFRRVLTSGRVRPYALVGFSAARTETAFTVCSALRIPVGGTAAVQTLVSCSEPDVIGRQTEQHTGLSLYALGGTGIEIPLGRRLRLIPDVRVDFSITSVIVRPTIGIGFAF